MQKKVIKNCNAGNSCAKLAEMVSIALKKINMEYTRGLLNQHIALAVAIELAAFFIIMLLIFDLARLSSLLFYKQVKPLVSRQEKKVTKPKALATNQEQIKKANRWKEIFGIYGLGFGAVAFYFLYVLLFNRCFPISMLGLLYLAGFTFLIITFLLLADLILRKFSREAYSRKSLWMIFTGELIILFICITVYLLN